MSNQAEPKKSPAIFMPICSRPPYRLQTISAGSILLNSGVLLEQGLKNVPDSNGPCEAVDTQLGSPRILMNIFPSIVSKDKGPKFSKGHMPHPGGNDGTKPGGEIRAATLSDVQFKDELSQAFNRVAHLPKMWPYLGKDDLHGFATACFDFLKRCFCTHPRTELSSLYATRAHYETTYMLSEVGKSANNLLKPPFRSFLSHPSDFPVSHTHSLFLSGSVTHTTKGDNPNESVPNRLPGSHLEDPERPALPAYRPFAGHRQGSTFRGEALRPCFPHHAADRPNEPSQGNAVGVGRREDRAEPQGPGQVAARLGEGA